MPTHPHPCLFHGGLLIQKQAGISSARILEIIKEHWIKTDLLKRKELPALGHGGTLDPFATGLLVVLVGQAVKLASYFLGSPKCYRGILHFGIDTASGDPTQPISRTSSHLPQTLEALQMTAQAMTRQPYFQIPPMFSAKKKEGTPLYELARQGKVVDRAPQKCQLQNFIISSYRSPCAAFQVECTAGTYMRVLAQDFAQQLGTLAILESLHRMASGALTDQSAWQVDAITQALEQNQNLSDLPCWIPFHHLLQSYPRAEVTIQEYQWLIQGKQECLRGLSERIQVPCDSPPALGSEALTASHEPLQRRNPRTHSKIEGTLGDSPQKKTHVGLYWEQKLVAIAKQEQGIWKIARVFPQAYP